MSEELLLYLDKCRFCHGDPEILSESLLIDDAVEKRFYFLSNVEFKSSAFLSNKICDECRSKLSAFYKFKQELISKQMKLYRLLGEVTETDTDEHFSIIRPIKLEPETNIKFENFVEPPVDFFSFGHDDPDTHQDNFFDVPIESIIKHEKYAHRVAKKSKHRAEKRTRRSVDSFKDPSRPACPICLKYFKRAGMVRAHIKRVHEKIKNFKCDNCGYRANSKHDILRHYKAHHLLYKEDVQEDRVVCPTCGKSFKGNNKLTYHIKIKHLNITKYSCDLCDFKTYSIYYIRHHMEVRHISLEDRKAIKGFKCNLCPSVLTTSKCLETHKLLKHSDGSRPHKCFCGKSYPLKGTLVSHIRIVHNGKRNHPCPHCDLRCVDKPSLRVHIESVHAPKQQIPCEICGKIFNTPRNLQHHMRYHEDPSHKCEMCGKMFHLRTALKIHIGSVHTGIIYNCGKCDRTFQSQSGLRRHMVARHAM